MSFSIPLPLATPSSRPDVLKSAATAAFLTILFGAVGVILVPLPPVLRDAFFCGNLILSGLILAASVCSPRALELSSFPGLLLATALFRICLGVSASRAILSGEDPGQIIESFGIYVSGNQPLTGLALFLIIQITQLIVMTKGAERVAEVAARFSLDALPGKQMSIDADLRAGTITDNEARAKREALSQESKFYGAMDGAMKFVKGESFATFALVAVNLVGGLVVGFVQKGWSLEKTVSVYVAFAIGDGLASQLPSLLMALSAGFLVTRSENSDERSTLGSEIIGQFFIHVTPLAATGILALSLALVPGFPGFSLSAIGIIFIVAALIAFKGESARAQRKFLAAQNEPIPLSSRLPEPASPLKLVLAGFQTSFILDPGARADFEKAYERLRAALTEKSGVPFPSLRIAFLRDAGGEDFQILIHDSLVEKGFLDAFAQKELTARDILLWRLGHTLKRHAADFLGFQEIRGMLDVIEDSCPDLVREVVPRKLTLAQFCEILRRLAEENVPIRDLKRILETLATCQTDNKDAVTLTENVRFGLKRAISRAHADPRGKIAVTLLDPALEKEIADNVRSDGHDCYLALSGERLRAIALGFKDALSRSQTKNVILTNATVRRYVRKIIEYDLPQVSVLSFQELEPDLEIEAHATVGLPSN